MFIVSKYGPEFRRDPKTSSSVKAFVMMNVSQRSLPANGIGL